MKFSILLIKNVESDPSITPSPFKSVAIKPKL
jgi:hypothetical protein